MKSVFFILLLALGGFNTATVSAVSICQNSACGRIVCQSGCVQRSVNGRCVENYCTGGNFRADSQDAGDVNASTDTEDSLAALDKEMDTQAGFGRGGSCVSCAGSCCRRGPSFLSAEQACKNSCGSFGCFTRCN